MSHAVTNSVNSTGSADLDQITADLASLKHDFTDLMQHVKTGAVNGVGEAANSAWKSVGSLEDKAHSLYGDALAQGQRAVKALGQQIEHRPVMAIAIAFGAGVLVRQLLSR